MNKFLYAIERNGQVQEGSDEVRRVFASVESLQQWYRITNEVPEENMVPYISVNTLSEILSRPSPVTQIKSLIEISRMATQRPEPEEPRPIKPELTPEMKDLLQKIQNLKNKYSEVLHGPQLKGGLTPENYLSRKLDIMKYEQYVKVCLRAIHLIAATADISKVLATIDLVGLQRELGYLIQSKGALNVAGSIRYHQKKSELEMWTMLVDHWFPPVAKLSEPYVRSEDHEKR